MNPIFSTFKELDMEQGKDLSDYFEAHRDESTLHRWHADVYTKRIVDFTCLDLVRSVNERTHLEHVLPECFVWLEHNPLEGDYFDGQLLASISQLPTPFWKTHQEAHAQYGGFLALAIKQAKETFDEENERYFIEAQERYLRVAMEQKNM